MRISYQKRAVSRKSQSSNQPKSNFLLEKINIKKSITLNPKHPYHRKMVAEVKTKWRKTRIITSAVRRKSNFQNNVTTLGVKTIFCWLFRWWVSLECINVKSSAKKWRNFTVLYLFWKKIGFHKVMLHKKGWKRIQLYLWENLSYIVCRRWKISVGRGGVLFYEIRSLFCVLVLFRKRGKLCFHGVSCFFERNWYFNILYLSS